MKIYIAHSGNYNFRDELYKPIRESELNKIHEIVLLHEFSDMSANTKELIKSFDLLIAEVSYPSTGEGIEVGWADAFDIPMLAIYKAGTHPSKSISVTIKDVIEYNDELDMITKLTGYLSNFKPGL